MVAPATEYIYGNVYLYICRFIAIGYYIHATLCYQLMHTLTGTLNLPLLLVHSTGTMVLSLDKWYSLIQVIIQGHTMTKHNYIVCHTRMELLSSVKKYTSACTCYIVKCLVQVACAIIIL